MPYQVFSKINNYTGKRLAGYKVEVGVGLGANFKTATDLGISDQLYLSLGIGEGTTGSGGGITPSDIFEPDGLATFSHGLFGAPDSNFTTYGFFATSTAYFPVAQTCTTGGSDVACPNSVVVPSGASVPASDTIFSSGPLSTNYTSLFGDWLPSVWAPEGIFYDDDNDPTTDPVLVAWWNGTAWLKGQADNFAPVSAAELEAWAANPLYAEDVIEDVLNLGPNYIVHVGDVNGALGSAGFTGSANITVRIIPVVAADQTQPAWVGTTPAPLVITPPPVVTPPVVIPAPVVAAPAPSSGGGGSFAPWFMLALMPLFAVRRRLMKK